MIVTPENNRIFTPMEQTSETGGGFGSGFPSGLGA